MLHIEVWTCCWSYMGPNALQMFIIYHHLKSEQFMLDATWKYIYIYIHTVLRHRWHSCKTNTMHWSNNDVKTRPIPPLLSCKHTSSPFFMSHNTFPRRIRLKFSMGKWPFLAINLLKSRTYKRFRRRKIASSL